MLNCDSIVEYTLFGRYKMHQWPNFYLWYVSGKVSTYRKQQFYPFWKKTFFRGQKLKITFLPHFRRLFLVLSRSILNVFRNTKEKNESYISRPFHRHNTCRNWTNLKNMLKKFSWQLQKVFPFLIFNKNNFSMAPCTYKR